MVFYVFFEPRVIADAADAGTLGLPLLISILQNLQQNCLILDFQDAYAAEGVRREVERLEESVQREELSPDAVKRLKAALAHLKKSNRFICEVEPDWMGAKDHLAIIAEQCEDLGLDVLVLAEDQELDAGVESTSLSAYYTSNFESTRADAASGKSYAPGALSETDFMDAVLGNALRYARRIDIYDKLVGSHFGDNFEYTIKQFIHWLGSRILKPEDCKLVFHFEEPAGLTGNHIHTQLKVFQSAAGLGALTIEVQHYDPRTMPHNRYIVTESFAIDVDRGMDFIDRLTRENRDVKVSILDLSNTSTFLRQYEGSRKGSPATI